MEKIFNFRELGGIPADGGRKVKQGIFFRSSLLDEASEKDIAELNRLGIKIVIDFRDDAEKFSNDVFERLDAKYVAAPVMNEDTKLVQLKNEKSFKNLKAALNVGPEDVCDLYRHLPFANESYKKLFGFIQDGQVPIVFNCSAGKDRTGIASALILGMLGASREDIIANYMLTEKHTETIQNKLSQKLNFLVRKFVMSRMKAVFETKEIYIIAALDEIEKRYGSFEKYFLEEYGFSENDISELRNRYLEA